MLKNKQEIEVVLQKYDIWPVELLAKGNATIVRTKNQSFFVRKMQQTASQLARWESVFHEAYRHHIHEVLPVYKTVDDSMYVLKGDTYYYVTPFVEADGSLTIADVFTSIGNIHKKTKRKMLVPKDKMVAHFKTYLHTMKEKHLYLQQIIDLFEQQHYMSPYELQVCSHFHIIDRAFQQCITHTTSFLSLCEEDDKNHIEWASSLCNNALTVDNVIREKELYITNWERASYDNATTDLISLCKNGFRENRYPLDEYVNGLVAYEMEYEFHEIEKHLLGIHLLHPVPYVEAVQSYVVHGRKRSVISHVIALEQIFRSISNSLFMFHEVDRVKRTSSDELGDQTSSK